MHPPILSFSQQTYVLRDYINFNNGKIQYEQVHYPKKKIHAQKKISHDNGFWLSENGNWSSSTENWSHIKYSWDINWLTNQWLPCIVQLKKMIFKAISQTQRTSCSSYWAAPKIIVAKKSLNQSFHWTTQGPNNLKSKQHNHPLVPLGTSHENAESLSSRAGWFCSYWNDWKQLMWQIYTYAFRYSTDTEFTKDTGEITGGHMHLNWNLKLKDCCAKQSHNHKKHRNTNDCQNCCCQSTQDHSCTSLSHLLVFQSLIPKSRKKLFKALADKMKTTHPV